MPPPLFALDRPLTAADLGTYAGELDTLQGNILKGHGRNHVAHVFLTFEAADSAAARTFIRTWAGRVTSATTQAAQARRRAAGEELFVAFFLSASGYRFLTGGGPAPASPPSGFSDVFWNGMQSANSRFSGDVHKDPPPSAWEPALRDLHAMVLLAHNDPSVIEREARAVKRQVQTFATVVVERGNRLVSSDGRSIEHFGYVDAVSQPLFFDTDLPPARNHWDPSAGPNLVLVRDPLGTSDADCGSYLVFRKLRQNVPAFLAGRSAFAGLKGFTGPDADKLAGAHMVGRFEDGTALDLSNVGTGAPTPDNNFNYGGDSHGLGRCPLDAHVRNVNPREPSSPSTRAHRIVRRGIPYGPPMNGNGNSAARRGLLFLCYQSDVGNQFEYLHASRFAGMDTMMRSHVKRSTPNGLAEFNDLVTLRGGEYFFAPSINVLRHWP